MTKNGDLLALRLSMAEIAVEFFNDEGVLTIYADSVGVYEEQVGELKKRLHMFENIKPFVVRLFSGDVDFIEDPIAVVLVGGEYAFFTDEPTQAQIDEFVHDSMPSGTITGVELHASGILMVV